MNKMDPLTVISGGQTGVDQLGLKIAKELNLATGGWAPKGWMTEAGSAEALLRSYGLKEHSSSDYPARTEANVRAADLTLIFSDNLGPGSKLTIRLCKKYGKPYMLWPLAHDLNGRDVKVVNIAGTRSISAADLERYSDNIRACLSSLKMSHLQPSARNDDSHLKSDPMSSS